MCMKLLLVATLAASAFASECMDDPVFTDADLPGGWGDTCSFWTGYGVPDGEILGPTFMYFQNFTTGEQSIPVVQLFGGGVKADSGNVAEAGGFWDSETFYPAAWYTAMKENCPVAFEQCETPWHMDETTSFDDATLLPGYGWCRTSNEAYVTEAREDPLCSQDMVDAGYCSISADNSYKPDVISHCPVDQDTGVQDCFDACLADQTCGCFSVTVNDPYQSGGIFNCTETPYAYCLLYPRTDYDGNVLTWDKANAGPVNPYNARSFAMAAREVTCMDCRTSGDRRSRKMARKMRKLLFASTPDDHDHMECCEGTDRR